MEQGTGYNSTVATTNAGVALECTSNTGSAPTAKCTNGTMTINGSHLTGTYNGTTYWNHTVTTGTASTSTPLTLTVDSNGYKTLNGSVTVQHNILQTTSITTYTNVTYNKSACCFPVSGSLATTYSGGSLDGKTESFTFDGVRCGIGTLTATDGTTSTVTMIHCL